MQNVYFNYYVIFKSSGPNLDGPIISYSNAEAIKVNNNGTMHLFDEDMYETLDAVEYLMHLPRNIYDVYNMDEGLMSASYDTPHDITILPDFLVTKMRFRTIPTMFVVTDNCDAAIKQVCESQKPLLGAFYSHELDEKLLEKLWMELWQKSKTEGETIVPDMDIQHILRDEYIKALPTLFYSRQFGRTDEFLSRIHNSTNSVEEDCVAAHWNYTVHLKTLVSMQNQRNTEWNDLTEQIYIKEHEKATKEFGISVVITLPGIAKYQKKLGLSNDVLSEKEQRIIRIIGVHRAIARGGVLIELPYLNDSIFQKYNELEQRCKAGTNNKYVWRALSSLGKQLGHYFSDDQVQILRHAKDITAFSDFPIGLVILEDDEVPLQCYKSISYLPLTPLTRRYQYEMNRSNQMYLGDHCKIAMAECIPNDEENKFVYHMSEEVHRVLTEQQQGYPNFSVVHKKIDSVKSMISFISTNLNADILYISAHGHYDGKRSMAGIMVGNEFWMANENIVVPPIIILSVCHASPRGMGTITIADLFLRNGALAVLGTFIPVNAHRNLILMTRLFTYIAEAQKKYDQYKTLADAWSGIVASNTIHELMLASPSFKTWMYSKSREGKTGQWSLNWSDV